MSIIRCNLPDGVHRFEPFTVKDYRDFLFIRNDLLNKTEEEQETQLNELAEHYFPDFPYTWRQYLFLYVFTGSIGKTKIPITYECPICKKVHKRLFNLDQKPLKHPEVKLDENHTLLFDFPEKQFDTLDKMVLNSIKGIKVKDQTYNWSDLSNENKEEILNAFDIKKFEEAVLALKPIYFKMTLKCCETNTLVYDSLGSIFRLLINPDEIFPFYEINHILVKHGYDTTAIMNMWPAERSIHLVLIEKDLKK